MVNRQAGFTLTELLVAVALVGVIGAVGASLSTASKTTRAVVSGYEQDIARLNTRRFSIISDGTTAAAIAAGLPPNVRGVIDAEMLDCPTSNRPPVCGPGVTDYIRFTTKTLRASGNLEELQSVDFRHLGNESGHNLIIFAYPVFVAAPPTTYNSTTNLGGPPYDLDASGAKWRVNCYANATCDPVTYLLEATEFDTGHRAASFLSVSMTGSITSSNATLVE